MLLSISNGDMGKFVPKRIDSFEELSSTILSSTYSFGYFINNHRKIENFVRAEAIGIDIDGGMTIEEAKEVVKHHKHIIATTRNHQKEKNGTITDRFRIVLFLSEEVKSAQDFEATWHDIRAVLPAADKACKDASRCFYPSQSIVSSNATGELIYPSKYIPVIKDVTASIVTSSIVSSTKGELSRHTLKFLQFGSNAGSRHNDLFKAATDCKEQGYSQDWLIDQLSLAIKRHGNWASDVLNEQDIATITDVYENRDTKYPPRISERAFNMVPIGELYKTKTEKDWLVDGLLPVAGLSILAGNPKGGKSTIMRQLVRSIMRGEEFLGRKCVQGSVFWMGLEEQQEDLNAGFKRLGIKDNEPLSVHVGGVLSDKAVDDLMELLCEHRPAIAVIDTLFDLIQVESEKNYNEVRVQMARLVAIARASSTHIITLHHTTKAGQDKDGKEQIGRGMGAILGSTALLGKVDTGILLESRSDRRYLSARGRSIKPFFNREILFDKETQLYSLGPQDPSEDWI